MVFWCVDEDWTLCILSLFDGDWLRTGLEEYNTVSRLEALGFSLIEAAESLDCLMDVDCLWDDTGLLCRLCSAFCEFLDASLTRIFKASGNSSASRSYISCLCDEP